MLLYDEVLDSITSGRFNSDYRDDPILSGFRIENHIKDCIVFGINNVAEYFWENFTSAPQVGDLPNVAAQYPFMWFEYTFAGVIGRRPESSSKEERSKLRIGVLTRSVRVADLLRTTDNGFIGRVSQDESENRMFYTEAALLIRNRYEAYSPNAVSIVGCDQTGKPLMTRHISDRRIADDAAIKWFLAVPAFLAISFMHCKNVKVESKYPPRPISRNGKPRVKFYTLSISPMKKILENEGQLKATGLKLSLHICRGHFKDYSKSTGLFGKYKGLYWWESHVRGSPAQGVVVKDYNVNPSAQ